MPRGIRSDSARISIMAIRLFPRGHIGSRPPTGAFTINRDSPQASGLAAWWPFLGFAGSNAHFDLVFGNSLTEYNTPTWVADGERGWSMLFTAASSMYLETTVAPVTSLPISFSAWVYPTVVNIF